MYDCTAWTARRRQVAAEAGALCIQLLLCMDAIQAFNNQGESLMPAESQILNLRPQLRSKSKFMLLHFLIPSTLKEGQQKKYFDYMVATDLNPLATTGIVTTSGRRVRVLIFSTPFDLPGYDKFFYLRGKFLHVLACILDISCYLILSHIYRRIQLGSRVRGLCSQFPFAPQ